MDRPLNHWSYPLPLVCRGFNLVVKDLNSANYQLQIAHLYDKITPEKSSIKVSHRAHSMRGVCIHIACVRRMDTHVTSSPIQIICNLQNSSVIYCETSDTARVLSGLPTTGVRQPRQSFTCVKQTPGFGFYFLLFFYCGQYFNRSCNCLRVHTRQEAHCSFILDQDKHGVNHV